MIDPGRLRLTIDNWVGSQPHPSAPRLTRAEYQSYERIAKLVHGARDQLPAQQVEQIGMQLKEAQMAPAEFERLWGIAQPVATRLLGTERKPTIPEIVHLRDAHPSDITYYYEEHPHPRYPEVTAGQMARMYTAAKPIAQQHANRNPVEPEVVTFIHGGYDANDIRSHYRG